MKKKDTTSASASGWDSTPGGEITPQQIQQKEFRVARFGAGYRMREVDEFLDLITDAMSALAADNERLRQGSTSGSVRSDRASTTPSAPSSVPSPADDAGRAAVEAFLRRERGFLQDLGALVQTHAEELRAMVRGVRRDVAEPAAGGAPGKEISVAAPIVEPEPGSAALDEPDEPEEIPDDPGTTEDGTEVPEDEIPANDPGLSAAPSTATTGVIAEEPIRLDEPEPARSGRSDDEDEGSLRELFWGEE